MKYFHEIFLISRVKKILVRTLLLVFVLAYILLMVLIVETYFQDPIFLKKTDVISFLTGAKILKDGAINNLYNITTQLSYQNEIVGEESRTFLLPFRNFPITAALFVPLLNLSLRNSYAFVFLINILILLVFHFTFTRSFLHVPKSGYLLLFSMFFYPSISNLVSGQYTSLILLIISFIYLSSKKENSFISGIFTSILAVKPQYLLFAPYAFSIQKSKKNFFIGFIVGIFVFILLNLIVAKDLRIFFDYPKFILDTENPIFGSRPYQLFTLFGIVKQILPNVNSAGVIFINFLIYFSIITLIFKKGLNSRKNDIFIIGVLTTTLFSVHALSHDLIIFLLPVYIFYLNKMDKHLLYSGFIFVTAGILSLAPTSIVTTCMIIIILITRLRSRGIVHLQ